MKKFSRLVLLTAVLTAVLCITAFAEDGWTQDSKGWRYMKDGIAVTNDWETDANGDYFYLGSDGYMMSSAFVDADRYVDSTGRMVKNAWRQINGKWYYFEATGRFVSGKRKLIENLWYAFDYDGSMITGWYSENGEYYYADGNSGGHLVVSAWRKLEPSADMETDSDSAGESYWFYFQASGKAVRASEADNREAVISGNRYAFDQCGRMKTGWVKLTEESPAIAGYKYYNDSDSLGTYGAAHTGWLSAYVPEELGDSGDVQWYYFDTKGVPCYGTVVPSNGVNLLKADLKKITKNGTTYSYLFNEKGNPVWGLQGVVLSDGTVTSMYFGTKNQCCLQKNALNIPEGDGTSWRYSFTTAGYGYTGVKNHYLYYKGKLQRAVDDSLAYYTVDGETWLVNSNGCVLFNYNRTKGEYDVEYRSDSSGHRDGGTAAESRLLEPEYQDLEN